jgi:uncharacterized protein
MHPLLDHVSHRPYPVPARPWIMAQTWVDLLFMHWPVRLELLRSLIPEPLEIDTFDGIAWIGVVPFAMTDIHFRNMPTAPYLSKFLELNVRSYVRWQGKSGVFFFSLDASNPIAVEVARLWFCLPYFHSQMTKHYHADEITYRSERTDGRAHQAVLETTYRCVNKPYFAQAGTLEAWLTERYCFFAAGKAGQIVRGDIHHKPWPLQQAQVEIRKNSMAEAIGIQLPKTEPLLHFVEKLETIEWSITSANEGKSPS